jgi:hypothetical protein
VHYRNKNREKIIPLFVQFSFKFVDRMRLFYFHAEIVVSLQGFVKNAIAIVMFGKRMFFVDFVWC